MMQTELFQTVPGRQEHADLPSLLARLTKVSKRPRYAFMVLSLIAKVADKSGNAGPYINDGERRVPVRDWLCDAMTPVAQRHPHRLALAEQVRDALAATDQLPTTSEEAQAAIAEEVLLRVRRSGKTAISRAVSELVKAELVTRYYKGRCVDHANRGAQRQAVYAVSAEVRRTLVGAR